MNAAALGMTLPNYFFCDLPPEAVLTSAMIDEACLALKRNRELYLAGRSTHALIRTITSLARDWQDAAFPFRRMLLDLGPDATGFSAATLAAGLDKFFSGFTRENLEALLLQDLGHLDRLDAFSASDPEKRRELASLVRGPELLVQVTGGVLPNPTITSLILGLLARSAQFVKCATGTSLIPRLFAHSLYEAEPKLGACLEIAEWKGGAVPWEPQLFAHADCVTATGSDETIAELGQQVPAQVRFLAYGHRVSFAYIAQETLAGMHPQKIAGRAGEDIVAWDQLGCLSPHVIYVETGGKVAPEAFAEMLAHELEAREGQQPRGRLDIPTASAIATRRTFYDLRAAHSSDTRCWCSRGSTAWTVVYESDPRFQVSCLHRFIYVKPVAHIQQATEAADSIRKQVSTVGLAATEERAPDLALHLARWGAARVCPLGQMQQPPVSWRHDGRPALGDLVTWADWQL